MSVAMEIRTPDDAMRLAERIRDKLNDGQIHGLPTGESIRIAGNGFIRTLQNSRVIRYDLDGFAALLWRQRDDWNKPEGNKEPQP